ncbi:helix-turn-helix domain-containing protein [Flavilitoribacter nigricans]|nr:helix-turn-helix domain-containing protein [Flavilitoribacter nigricans]
MKDKQVIEELRGIEKQIADLRFRLSDNKQRYLGRLAEIICEVFNITEEQLTGPERNPEYTDARFAFSFFARKHFTWKEIGEALGDRDHSTAKYQHTRYLELHGTDLVFTQKADQVQAKITEYEYE